MKILGYVLEDDQDMLETIEEILKDATFEDVEFETFSNAVTFKKKLTDQVDIIILDYYVPPFTAIDMLKFINQVSEDCLITLISNRKDVDVLMNGINYGADKFIHKMDANFKEQLIEFTRQHVEIVRKRKKKKYQEQLEDDELRERYERLQKKLVFHETTGK